MKLPIIILILIGIVAATFLVQTGFKFQSNAASKSQPRTDCGDDDLGLPIPCYKIGVFDEATLKATVADAKVASANYALYRKILEDLKTKVNIDQAAAKTAAAQTAADACIKAAKTGNAGGNDNQDDDEDDGNGDNGDGDDGDDGGASGGSGGSGGGDDECQYTFRPGPRNAGDNCAAPLGYVYDTIAETDSSGGTNCKLSGDPIEGCRARPW